MGIQATVFAGPDGLVRFIYDDDLAGLLDLGRSEIKRASHVEPTPIGWVADMSPSRGPGLGPFALRSMALAAEHEWLESQLAGGTPAIPV